MPGSARKTTVTVFSMFLLLGCGTGAFLWLQNEVKTLRAELATFNDGVNSSPPAAILKKSEETLQKEIQPLRIQLKQVASDTSELVLRCEAIESDFQELSAEQQQLATGVAQVTENRELLQETSRRIEELKPFRDEVRRTASQASDLGRRIKELQTNFQQLSTTQQQLATSVAQSKKDRALLEETSKRVETIAENAKRTVAEVKPEVTIQPPAPKPAPPPRQSADLIIKSVSVSSEKARGGVWDDSGDPDLQVEVTIGGQTYTTGVQKESTYASFDEKLLRVEEGDTITVKVVDKDVLFNDIIGEYEKKITASTLNARKADWSFDQVYSLELKFEP